MKCTQTTSRFGHFIGEKPSLGTPQTVQIGTLNVSISIIHGVIVFDEVWIINLGVQVV